MTGTRKNGCMHLKAHLLSVSYQCMTLLQAHPNCDHGHCRCAFVPLRDSGGMIQNVIIHVGKLSINHNG